jgi:hypothetical protein
MASTGVAEPVKLKVFISYSRNDEDFAQDLLAGLEWAGFEPYLISTTLPLAKTGRHALVA